MAATPVVWPGYFWRLHGAQARSTIRRTGRLLTPSTPVKLGLGG